MKVTDSIDNLEFDYQHIWHPYSAMHSDLPMYEVVSARGSRLKLASGEELIDGMSSWWCMIHGYNHPELNQAITDQLTKMAHVMFGGLTHPAAIALARKLVEITPAGLEHVFFADSGSVAVEVAMKMAIQYWYAKDKSRKQHFIALRHGYHGDTFAAMSVSDPETGMHGLYAHSLAKQFFVPRPEARFADTNIANDILALEQLLKEKQDEVAAVILEPIVQGAGGMWFYSADYLAQARKLCRKYDVLLIADEIATGFGRSGKLFACEHAAITPDIMCIGKALTGGYMTLAATLCTREVAAVIDKGKPGVFMHGPTFMANPLACAVALESIRLLLAHNWQANIQRIENQIQHGLQPCRSQPHVADVRVLGAIGVVELKQPVDMKAITREFVKRGVWVRPFGKLVYLMPPYIISDEELATLLDSVVEVVRQAKN